MDLVVHFGNYDSLRAPVTGLLVYLGIDVELGKEGLNITLVLNVQKASLEVLSEGQLLVDVYLD